MRIRGSMLAAVLALVIWAMPAAAQSSTAAPSDGVADGVVRGALVGAGAGFAAMAITYNNLGEHVEAPAFGAMAAPAAGFGAGVGALIGYLIDRGHREQPKTAAKQNPRQLRTVTLAPSIARNQKSVRMVVRF